MGRRRESRLAAKSAAGRRVKLDLCPESSGDLGGSSRREEAGGDGDSKTHTLFPSSPSSSGQQQQNPLLLLEQYSDEEFDEDLNGHNHAVENASVGMDEESNVATGNEVEDGEVNFEKESVQKVEQLLMDRTAASQDPPQELEKESITEIDTNDFQKNTNKTEEATYPAGFDEHLVEDASSGWQMVLHEESNQYYYWNVVTGETSWEVPNVLAQEITETSAKKVAGEGKTDAVMCTYKSSTHVDMEEDDVTTREHSVHSEVKVGTKDYCDQRTQMDGSSEGFKSDSIEDKEGNVEANHNNEILVLGGHFIESRSGADLSSQLINHCESMLERLNLLKCFKCYLEGQDLILTCRLEIEMRLADIKALSSHESSMLPFWLHCDAQLKRLEAAIDGIQQNNSESLGGFGATIDAHKGVADGAEIDSGEKNVLLAAVESHARVAPDKSTFEAHNSNTTTVEHEPLAWYSSTCPVSDVVNDVGGESEATGTEKECELNPRPALHSVEDTDMDMDMDMEVEDTYSMKSPHEGALGASYHVSIEQSNMHCTLSDQESAVPGQVFSVAPDNVWVPPPPPDNEPIPPPPPDDESFPPPPPEEPPETSYPPSHLGSAQNLTYSEPFNLSYPGSGLGYYVQTNPEVSGTTLYTHPEGGQVTFSHVPHYYEGVSNLYAVAPMIVNPVEPTPYYGLQNGTLNPVSLMINASEFSGTQSEPVPEETGTTGSLDSCPEAGSNLLLKNNINVDKSCHDTVKTSQYIPKAQSPIRASATSSVTNDASVSSSSDITTSASATAAKSQSKVVRAKKHAVAVVSTLRSNKKVSSLVDKWKAAKEELHEEEKEPEDAYEILKKKREREIEQWRAHQIASGEAKDNANFQPLGGDWRERVKRRRAEKMKGTGETSPDVVTNGDKQTNLLELSKGLPSGWQAYWDDSSKQVYYGNVLTSETTWIKPTH